MNPFVVPTKFTAVDQMSGQVRNMAGNVHDAFSRLNSGVARSERLWRRMTPGISDATKQLLSYAKAGTFLALGAFSGNAVMNYETAVQSLSAVTGTYGKDLVEMRSIVNDTANDTKKSAVDVAGAFEVVGSMMSQYLKDPKALRSITEAGITLAKASRQELVPTLEQLTSIMNQFDLKANQAHDTINRLTAGEIVGSLRTAQVTEALQEFGAGAFAANIDLSESVALVEALAKQMKTDKIGVGARNILTVMDSATGLAKKARKELRHAGVDMKLLMDSSKSLSVRLHELAKLQGNEKAITKVFGRENKTAAQVIFNQLATYDQFVAQIRKTNAAEQQAATNSDTLAQAIDRLKNTWVNYLVTGDAANEGLSKAKDIISFVTDHMDGIVSTGLNVLKFYALWKAAIIAQNVVLVAGNVVLGVQNALFASSVGLLEANVAAQKVAIVTKRALGLATEMLAGDFTALNAVMAANPIGLVITALAAMAAVMYLVSERNEELTEQYRERVSLDIPDEVRKETAEVEKLVEKYVMLGKSIKEANALAMNQRMVKLDMERHRTEQRINELKASIANTKQRNVGMFGMAGVSANAFVSDGGQAKELQALQLKAKKLAVDQSFEVQRAKTAVSAGVVDYNDVAGVFASGASRKKQVSADLAPGERPTYNYMGEKKQEYGPLIIDYNKLRESLSGTQRVKVEFVGAPAGTRVSGDGVTQTPNSY